MLSVNLMKMSSIANPLPETLSLEPDEVECTASVTVTFLAEEGAGDRMGD